MLWPALAGAQTEPAPDAPSSSAQSAAAEAEVYVLEPGTRIPLAMINSVSTKNSAVGDRIYLETVFPILVNGRIVIPPGSYVAGTVTNVKRPGRVKGRGELYVRFDSLTLPNGVTRDFRARIGSLDGRASEDLDRQEGTIKSEGNKSGDARNVGEAAATIAALEMETGRRPEAAAVQWELARAGVPLVWFDDLPLNDPSFAAIQVAALRGLYPVSDSDLHAAPEAMVTRGEAAQALALFYGIDLSRPAAGRIDVPTLHPYARAIEAALEGGWMRVDHRNWFHPDIPFYLSDLDEKRLPGPAPEWRLRRSGPVLRRELAEALTGLFSIK